MSAVQRCDELVVDHPRSPGPFGRNVVRLKRDRRATVRLDRYGIATARNPSKALIAAMFKVASMLDANVYSERFNKYASADDWTRRRTDHRRAFDQQRAFKEKRKQLRYFALWCILCAISALLGLLLGSLFLALWG